MDFALSHTNCLKAHMLLFCLYLQAAKGLSFASREQTEKAQAGVHLVQRDTYGKAWDPDFILANLKVSEFSLPARFSYSTLRHNLPLITTGSLYFILDHVLAGSSSTVHFAAPCLL